MKMLEWNKFYRGSRKAMLRGARTIIALAIKGIKVVYSVGLTKRYDNL